MTARITAGIDAIEIDRIEATVDRFGERFLQRIYTEAELAYCRGKPQSLAGRFAAKEAASKALGVGIRALRWRDIETVRGLRGKPRMVLHGKAAELARAQGVAGVEVSISHSRSDAYAVVIMWSEG